MTTVLSNKKILIVEDEQSMLRALVDKFRREGFSISQAKDGHSGLARALEDRPDLILLDVMMPNMDGPTMLKKLRGDSLYGTHGKTVPVLFLTNLSADSLAAQKIIPDIDPSNYLVKTDLSIQDVVERAKEKLSNYF